MPGCSKAVYQTASAVLHKRMCQYYGSLKSKRAAKLLKYAAYHYSRRTKNKGIISAAQKEDSLAVEELDTA